MNRPRRALLLDTETTGTDPQKDRIIEIAVCLYDLALGSPIAVFSALARSETNAAEHVNGISVALLSQAFEQERVWVGVCDLMAHADVILAHKASFDKSFVEADAGFQEMWKSEPKALPWICTHSHITWPGVEAGAKTSNNLTSLALSYGVGVLSAHRALIDVDTLARVLTRLKERGTDLLSARWCCNGPAREAPSSRLLREQGLGQGRWLLLGANFKTVDERLHSR